MMPLDSEPVRCPDCGSPVEVVGADIFCDNDECPPRDASEETTT